MLFTVARTVCPRGVRLMTTAATAAKPVAASSPSHSATITTTASPIANPGSSAKQSHVVSSSGSLKSANRHYHANGSESSAGVNESIDGQSVRRAAQASRMHEAKQLAGL